MRDRGRAKGLRLYLRDGRIISYDRRGAEDVLERLRAMIFSAGISRHIYEHCLAEHILGANSLFERDPQEVSRTTRRRMKLRCC
jgi:hypothetical protein